MPTIPHLAFPLRYVNGRPVTVEQGSDDEIKQAVEVLFRYRPGFRPELPDFGVDDQTFRTEIDIDRVRAQIEEWEPRVSAFIDAYPDRFEALVQHLAIELKEGGAGG